MIEVIMCACLVLVCLAGAVLLGAIAFDVIVTTIRRFR
jgi:hypothetical protein